MFSHHTKTKGDQGLGYIIADLLANGIQVALPISEHLPFDCIAISGEGKMLKISVKYRKIYRGKVEVALKSVWSNSKGYHSVYYNKDEFDVTAIYCPDTKKIYYVRQDEVGDKKSINLRIEKPKLNIKTIE